MQEEKKDVEKMEKVVEETTKTYTKEDIDNSFNAGMKKAKAEFQKNSDYKSFLEWKKNNQNESDKLNELETSNEKQTKEIEELKTLIKIKDSDCKKEYQSYVSYEVNKLIDDTTDFDTALKNFKKENPQFFGETIIKKVQTSPILGNGGTSGQTTNDIMNNLLRGVKK